MDPSSNALTLQDVLKIPIKEGSNKTVTLGEYVNSQEWGILYRLIKAPSKGWIGTNVIEDTSQGKIQEIVEKIKAVNAGISQRIQALQIPSEIGPLVTELTTLDQITENLTKALRLDSKTKKEIKDHLKSAKKIDYKLYKATRAIDCLKGTDPITILLKNQKESTLRKAFLDFLQNKNDEAVTEQSIKAIYQCFFSDLINQFANSRIEKTTLYTYAAEAKQLQSRISNDLPDSSLFDEINEAIAKQRGRFRRVSEPLILRKEEVETRLRSATETLHQEGRASIRLIPEDVISDLETNSYINEIWKTRDQLIAKMIEQVPNSGINPAQSPRLEIVTSDYDLYGIKLDKPPEPNVLAGKVALTINNKKYHIKLTPPFTEFKKERYKESTNQFFPYPVPKNMSEAIRTPANGEGVKTVTFCSACGWGEESEQAASTASANAQKFTESGIGDQKTVREIAQLQVQSLLHAHSSVSQIEKTAFAQATIAGKYLIATTLGDPRIFIFKAQEVSKKCIELTEWQGGQSHRDPGGYIGGETNAPADLRNLACYIYSLDPGDKVILCSSSKGWLFSPQALEFSPGMYDLIGDSWNNKDPKHHEVQKEESLKKFLGTVFYKKSPQEISDAIDEYTSTIAKANLLKLYELKSSEDSVKEDPPPLLPNHGLHCVIGFDPAVGHRPERKE